MITLYELREFYRPTKLEEKDMGDRGKVAKYVEHAQSYMIFLEGIITGLQSKISKEEADE